MWLDVNLKCPSGAKHLAIDWADLPSPGITNVYCLDQLFNVVRLKHCFSCLQSKHFPCPAHEAGTCIFSWHSHSLTLIDAMWLVWGMREPWAQSYLGSHQIQWKTLLQGLALTEAFLCVIPLLAQLCMRTPFQTSNKRQRFLGVQWLPRVHSRSSTWAQEFPGRNSLFSTLFSFLAIYHHLLGQNDGLKEWEVESVWVWALEFTCSGVWIWTLLFVVSFLLSLPPRVDNWAISWGCYME